MPKIRIIFPTILFSLGLCIFFHPLGQWVVSAETANDYRLIPPFVTSGVPPLVMLVLGRDHKLYYEAYNDASDLDGDGILDVGYKPNIDYYGYFDSHKCYDYSTVNSRFEPFGTTADKTCTGGNAGKWSGDFLNYLTMSRMDCLRKVLYGGYRSTDTATVTVLQRAYIPQDAHSWGKEYESVAHDGYDIRLYSPLSLPSVGLKHLFASSATSDNGNPLLRVLPNNTHRIWEWVSKERPVAGKGNDSCTNQAGGIENCESVGGNYSGSPTNHDEYEALIQRFGNSGHQLGSGFPTGGAINGSGNPYTNPHNSNSDYYLNIFTGDLVVTTGGTYEFAVDGDDAVEVIIDGAVVAGWYGGHGNCNCFTHKGTVDLSSGHHSLVFRHQETAGGDNYYLRWKGPDSKNVEQIVPSTHYANLVRTTFDVYTPSSSMTDYVVRVVVGAASMPESNCKQYPSGVYKPTGLLQRNGESDRMYFGLVTGSYTKNKSGGVLRKNIGTITDEISITTGQFRHNTDNTYSTDTTVGGIIKTIDKMRIVGFDYGGYSYNEDCGWIATEPLSEGHCRMWGNPLAEMMYESLRYFSGSKAPTSDFVYSGTTDDDLGLPQVAWQDPYEQFSYCAKPFMLVISDINPTFDTDQLPGSVFYPSFSSSTLGTLNVGTLADTISNNEALVGNYYIGERGGATQSYDSSCSPKAVTSLGEIRGLCPEEPTKQGGYYSASVAYYGLKSDINPAQGSQNVTTYAVGLASPLPRIYIPLNGKTITLVPFAKSVGGFSIDATEGKFQPTNTIVDFYVDTLTSTYGKFRINFEDVEQGADHDMDAIIIYEYQVSGNTLTITLTSEYAAGSIKQHMGYIISGTTTDGTYLEVRDKDTGAGDDVNYFLDTPQHAGQALPLTHTRTFSLGTSTAAKLLENPLWYAAKWGGYEEDVNDANNIPDKISEWDKDLNGVPDNYFYVTNPLKLEEQLNKSFADILRRSSSGTAASVISSTRSGEGAVYQAMFYSEYKDPTGKTVNWVGEVHALMVDSYGNMREDTNGNRRLDLAEDYIIEFSQTSTGTIYKYRDGDPSANPPRHANGKLDTEDHTNPIVISTMRNCNASDLTKSVANRDCVSYLWSADDWLNEISNENIVSQRTYSGTGNSRHIFTFIDGKTGNANLNMIPEVGEVVDFIDTETSIFHYIHLYPPFGSSAPSYIENIRTTNPTVFNDFVSNQSKRIINYIRGKDQIPYLSNTSPAYTIPAFRSRQSDYDEDGVVETWRLGDVVYSTPTIVGVPAESYDMLYKDDSYTEFYKKYKNRRTIVYAGGNDGMLHAFNAGFYIPDKNEFRRGYDPSTKVYSDTGLPLGAELWGYIPYNLLPHLYWLTEVAYNLNNHVSYVDLKPRVFDAKVFPSDAVHPNGWGTVMVCGMRFGGGKIRADVNKGSGMTFDADNDRTMTSAYIVMDITDPETRPTLLAEVSSEALGFTTCYPNVFAMKGISPAVDNNNWYLVLGSGPHGTNGADNAALTDAASNQQAKIVLLDLKAMVQSRAIRSFTSAGSLADGVNVFASLDANSFVSDPISVDFDMNYRADVVYFGTVSGSFTNGAWGGKLRRLVFEDGLSPHVADGTLPTNWTGDSTLIDLSTISAYNAAGQATSNYGYGQPIVAAPTAAVDGNKDRWVFFGTGRFFNRQDATNATASHQQSYYGIKEPKASSVFTWGTVGRGGLLNVSAAKVFDGGNTVTGTSVASSQGGTNPSFNDVASAVNSKAGWLIDFDTSKERNLGQATLLGNVLTFTTYVPSEDLCQFEGNSSLYGLIYNTGTAYCRSVMGKSTTSKVSENGVDKYEVLKKVVLGKGVTTTPNVHTGREEGSEAYVQTSTGAIVGVHEQNPGMVKSGVASWEEW